MKLEIKFTAILIFATVLNTACWSEQSGASFCPQLNKLDKQIPQILDSAGIQGISIAIVNDGQVFKDEHLYVIIWLNT